MTLHSASLSALNDFLKSNKTKFKSQNSPKNITHDFNIQQVGINLTSDLIQPLPTVQGGAPTYKLVYKPIYSRYSSYKLVKAPSNYSYIVLYPP